MSTGPDLAPRLRPWLEGRTSAPSGAALARALDQVATTRQQRPLRVALDRRRSAAPLIVAAAIAAVGTGAVFLAVGQSPSHVRPTDSPSPIPTAWSPPPGLALDEVHPGVLRVVNDGVRDLAGQVPREDYSNLRFRTVSGRDGTIWVLWPDAFFRLGDPNTYSWGEQSRGPGYMDDFEVSPDGRLWWVVDGTLWSFDGHSWTDWQRPGAFGVEIALDGTVWAAWDGSVGRLDGDRWTVDAVRGGDGRDFSVSDDDTLWVPPFVRRKGLDWESLPPRMRTANEFDVGLNGTAWERSQVSLGVLDDNEWRIYGASAGVTSMKPTDASFGRFEVAPDGSAWAHTSGTGGCAGLGRFDRIAWTHLPYDICVYNFDIGPDGAVWIEGGRSRDGPAETYVIPPGGMSTAAGTSS